MSFGKPIANYSSAWRDQVRHSLLNLDFRPMAVGPVTVEASAYLIQDGVRVARLTHSPGITFRDAELVRDGTDGFTIVCASVGGIHFAQQGRDGRLAAGQMMMFRNSMTGDLGSKRVVRCMPVVIPYRSLDLPSADLDRIIARPWTRPSTSLPLLRGYLALLATDPVAPGTEAAALAARHVLDLVRLTALEQARGMPGDEASASDSVRASRLKIALALIAREFRDPGLSLASVAASQHISVSYLQKLFEDAGIRFVAHVTELRLQEALQNLCEPAKDARTILDIALAAGFSDISHFNRLFRRRFDATPKALRSATKRKLAHPTG